MSNPVGSQSQPTQQTESVICCNPLQCRCGRHWFPQHILLALLLHLCLQNNFNTRVVLNVAIVEMVAPPEDEQNYTIACPNFGTPEHTQKGGTFPWPQQTKSLVLYAFYIGYSVSQVPGGWLADKFGARPVIITCVVFTTVSTALFPLVTHQFGYLAAVGLRFILGAAHGPIMPCVSSLISIWIPAKDRSTWGGIAFAGTNLGTILGNLLTGILIHTFDNWAVAFYFWSAYSLFFLVLVLLFVFSYPETHPFISRKEIDYLNENAAGTRSKGKKSFKTPWKGILTNLPYWANVAAQFGHNYIYFTLITYLPTYMRDILQFDVSNDGLFSAIPFICLWITSLILSGTSRYFIKVIGQHNFDRIFGAGCNVASTLLVLGAIYAGCNRVLCIALYNISMIIKAFYYVTLPTNINALSRNYGGIMFGILNAVGSLSGIIGNFIIGTITKDKQFWEWKLAFWITLGLELATTVFYLIFSSVERQEFDYEEDEPREVRQ